MGRANARPIFLISEQRLVTACSVRGRCLGRARHAGHRLFVRRGRGTRRGLLHHRGAGSQEHGHRWKRRNENDKFFHSVGRFSLRTIRRKCCQQMY